VILNCLYRWAEENAWQAAGPAREIYLEYRPGGNPEHFVTEVQLPVTPIRKEKGGMEPKIIKKDAFKVVGMQYVGKNEHGEIGQMWDRFIPRIPEIRHSSDAMGEISFGICHWLENPSEVGEFSYVAGQPVTELANLPDRMVGVDIPAQTYAVTEALAWLRSVRPTTSSSSSGCRTPTMKREKGQTSSSTRRSSTALNQRSSFTSRSSQKRKQADSQYPEKPERGELPLSDTKEMQGLHP
jgi:predicted transcriptional regulator YdeE